MFVVIAYDIEDDKRRNRVAKLLEAHGTRVQYSVFETHLSQAQLDELQTRLTDLLEPVLENNRPAAERSTASVRCYRLCGSCADRVWVLGDGEVTRDASFFMI